MNEDLAIVLLDPLDKLESPVKHPADPDIHAIVLDLEAQVGERPLVEVPHVVRHVEDVGDPALLHRFQVARVARPAQVDSRVNLVGAPVFE